MGRRDFPPGRLQCASLRMLVRPVVLAVAVGLALSAGAAHAGKRKSRGSAGGAAAAPKSAPPATEIAPNTALYTHSSRARLTRAQLPLQK